MVAWRLAGRSIVVVGGGTVAAGRVRLALEADARVTVVAPRLGAELRHRLRLGEVSWMAREFEESDLLGADMVLTALDDAEASRAIALRCRSLRIPVNAADRPELCDFWFPSVHRDGPLQVAVSTNGQGPSLARRIKDELVAALPREAATAVCGFGRLRRRIREIDPAPPGSRRRMGWIGNIGRTWSFEAISAIDLAAVQRLVRDYPNPPRQMQEEMAIGL